MGVGRLHRGDRRRDREPRPVRRRATVQPGSTAARRGAPAAEPSVLRRRRRGLLARGRDTPREPRLAQVAGGTVEMGVGDQYVVSLGGTRWLGARRLEPRARAGRAVRAAARPRRELDAAHRARPTGRGAAHHGRVGRRPDDGRDPGALLHRRRHGHPPAPGHPRPGRRPPAPDALRRARVAARRDRADDAVRRAP